MPSLRLSSPWHTAFQQKGQWEKPNSDENDPISYLFPLNWTKDNSQAAGMENIAIHLLPETMIATALTVACKKVTQPLMLLFTNACPSVIQSSSR
mgnify:FL=1